MSAMLPEQVRKHRASVLATLTDNHPAWVVLSGILTEVRDGSTAAVADSKITPDERAWQAGYLSCVLDLRETLEELRNEGMSSEGDEEAKI